MANGKRSRNGGKHHKRKKINTEAEATAEGPTLVQEKDLFRSPNGTTSNRDGMPGKLAEDSGSLVTQ
jgi:hypothetical protein